MSRTLSFSALAAVVVVLGRTAHAQELLNVWNPPGASSQLGREVEGLGDVDGDGVPDFAVAATAAAGTGAVFVYSGATGAVLHVAVGDSPSAAYGVALSGLGDVDGDAVPDYVVARLSLPGGQVGVGGVDCRSGADGNLLYALQGGAGVLHVDAGIGLQLDDIGDIDGDGVSEFAIGSPADGVSFAGRVFVVSGGTGAIIRTFAPTAPNYFFGRAVCGLGDVDHDGWPDIAVSARTPNGSIVQALSANTGLPVFTLFGGLDFGLALASAGDADGDGTVDLGVGEPGENRVQVFSGAAQTLLFTATGVCGAGSSGLTEGVGYTLDDIGDVDGDGRDDLALGSRNRASAYVVSGLDGGTICELRLPPTPGITQSLITVRGVGDVDGDGRPDVLVGAPFDDSSGSGGGRARLYSVDDAIQVGMKSGFGDGTGTPCPCGNTGQTGAGCANSTGSGATLTAFGSSSVALDDVYFAADHLPPSASAMLFSGTLAKNGGLGVPFADGLLVCGGTTKRIKLQSACANGEVRWGSGLDSPGLWQPGDTRYFQAWYRNVLGPCGATFNYSNAVEIVFTP